MLIRAQEPAWPAAAGAAALLARTTVWCQAAAIRQALLCTRVIRHCYRCVMVLIHETAR